jgi:hypothetical protein
MCFRIVIQKIYSNYYNALYDAELEYDLGVTDGFKEVPFEPRTPETRSA